MYVLENVETEEDLIATTEKSNQNPNNYNLKINLKIRAGKMKKP